MNKLYLKSATAIIKISKKLNKYGIRVVVTLNI